MPPLPKRPGSYDEAISNRAKEFTALTALYIPNAAHATSRIHSTPKLWRGSAAAEVPKKLIHEAPPPTLLHGCG